MKASRHRRPVRLGRRLPTHSVLCFFHVATGALLLYTDRLLPRGRAVAVTRLVLQLNEESVWDYASEHLGIEPGLPAYRALLTRVPRAFPSLVWLLVVAQGLLLERRWVGGRAERVEPPSAEPVVKDCLLSCMDAVVCGFARPLGECVLAMRHVAFDRLIGEEMADADKVETREGEWVQFWRPVSVARGKEALDTGYWVRRCPTDTMLPDIII